MSQIFCSSYQFITRSELSQLLKVPISIIEPKRRNVEIYIAFRFFWKPWFLRILVAKILVDLHLTWWNRRYLNRNIIAACGKQSFFMLTMSILLYNALNHTMALNIRIMLALLLSHVLGAYSTSYPGALGFRAEAQRTVKRALPDRNGIHMNNTRNLNSMQLWMPSTIASLPLLIGS
jgi:hypothetical protein